MKDIEALSGRRSKMMTAAEIHEQIEDALSAARYQAARDTTEQLAAPLSAEDQTVQSMPDTSPTKWHRSHTTWFFETFILSPFDDQYREFNPLYGYLFNSYYETVGARYPRPQRGLLSRPGIEEIASYRHYVDDAMHQMFGAGLSPAQGALVELGIHHEQQHQELILMDIKHVLSHNPARPAYVAAQQAVATSRSTPIEWFEHDGGILEIGHTGGTFAFDNERPRHRVLLPPFALANRPISCGDWLGFIDDGGYQRPELWLSEGWAAVTSACQRAPLYWSSEEIGHEIFTLEGQRALDLSEPVCHLSYFEAHAYARWAGSRLPTEAEWEIIAAQHAPSIDTTTPARVHPRTASGGVPHFGEVWEWTSSAYLPYPGFQPAPGAVGEYNGKFMVNQQVLRGGCCATPPGHARVTYRNFFPAAAQWAFSGARLARDL